jgi:hypothetical protein
MDLRNRSAATRPRASKRREVYRRSEVSAYLRLFSMDSARKCECYKMELAYILLQLSISASSNVLNVEE